MIKSVASIYLPRFARTVVYMLQSCEYDIRTYLKWLWRTDNFGQVAYRRDLQPTGPAKLLLTVLRIGIAAQILGAGAWGLWGAHNLTNWVPLIAAALIITAPILWAHLVVLPLLAGRFLIIKPKNALAIWRSKTVLAGHLGLKIAVAGSYGKTTMKEILLSVLSEGKKVAATPANKNVSISHAQFTKNLTGDEEILIIEYGEGAPGDVARFANTTTPNLGVITGLAPAHLDKYKTLQAAGKDIFSLADYLKNKNVYVNAESLSLKPFIKKSHHLYSAKGIDSWKVEKVSVGITGVKFVLKGNGLSLNLSSGLLGRHQIGSLAFAAALAHKLGLAKAQIEKGVAATKPFEHRMQPQLLSGGWLIDDSYNGNIEGMKAGLELLKELPAKRKIYVTPGLVDQGSGSSTIHQELGQLIAKSNPDKTVLIKHSVTDDILKGLNQGNYRGEIVIETDPLEFYTNIKHLIAAGDLVLMQNDWPDNYN